MTYCPDTVLSSLGIAEELVIWCCVRDESALLIHRTSLRSFDLDSLEEIRSGNVIVTYNADLCYASNIQWKKLVARGRRLSIRENRNYMRCGDYLVFISALLYTVSQKK